VPGPLQYVDDMPAYPTGPPATAILMAFFSCHIDSAGSLPASAHPRRCATRANGAPQACGGSPARSPLVPCLPTPAPTKRLRSGRRDDLMPEPSAGPDHRRSTGSHFDALGFRHPRRPSTRVDLDASAQEPYPFGDSAQPATGADPHGRRLGRIGELDQKPALVNTDTDRYSYPIRSRVMRAYRPDVGAHVIGPLHARRPHPTNQTPAGSSLVASAIGATSAWKKSSSEEEVSKRVCLSASSRLPAA
jgi:hypothetical protein